MMDPRNIAKQMIQFNKAAFDNTFDAMAALQTQTEKLMIAWMEQNPLLPTEGKAAITDWFAAYGKVCTDFKNAIDASYKKVEDFFGEAEKGKKG